METQRKLSVPYHISQTGFSEHTCECGILIDALLCLGSLVLVSIYDVRLAISRSGTERYGDIVYGVVMQAAT